MGVPNDVVGVDRFVRVVMSTMFAASRYTEQWPESCLSILENIARELKPLLKPFGRPLGKELGVDMGRMVSGIVLREWAFLFGQPRYVVCYSDEGWVLIKKPENKVLYLGNKPVLLANIIGNHIGGAELFIDACVYAISELFRKRKEQLDELEQSCLLGRMYEACNQSKWPDTRKFIDGLAEK